MPFEVIHYTDKMSESYAEIRAGCEAKGELVGPDDLLIAATVLANNGTLATRNTKEFKLIPGLKLTDW